MIVVTLFSCNDSPEQSPSNKTTDHVKGKITKPPRSSPDTLIIDSPTAIFYFPDSLQLQKAREIMDRVRVENEEHDCFYQRRNSLAVLKKYWPKIQIIETTSSRYLLFKKKDGKVVVIDLDTKGEMCGMYLFDGKKDPELTDMMNIETALGYYFSK